MRLFAAVLSIALVMFVALPASAALETFDFSSGSATNPTSTPGNLALTVDAFVINGSGSVTQSSGGLGVNTSGTGDTQELNGSGISTNLSNGDEYLRFTFGEEVTLKSITFSAVGSNDDAAITFDTLDSPGSGDGLDLPSGTNLGGGNYRIDFNQAVTVIRLFALNGNDEFRVLGMTVEAADIVPEPATFVIWPALGLALVGFRRWRRR